MQTNIHRLWKRINKQPYLPGRSLVMAAYGGNSYSIITNAMTNNYDRRGYEANKTIKSHLY